jgi:nicotinamidase-related amidase
MNTAFDAVNLGYRTIVASDCCSATDAAAHAAALDVLRLIGEVAEAEALMGALR